MSLPTSERADRGVASHSRKFSMDVSCQLLIWRP